MNRDCLDSGIIQAFLDGELSHDESSRVAAHSAMCDQCSSMIAVAEEESALVFSALDRELDTLVPTQRLWGRINGEIEAERENRSIWTKLLAFVTVSFSNPSLTAAAGLLIVATIFAAVWIDRQSQSVPGEIAGTLSTVSNTPPTNTSQPETVINELPETPVTSLPERVVSKPAYVIERAAYRSEPRRASAPIRATVTAETAAYMPGEDSYVRTISSLKKTVDIQKDSLMRPSERIAYERDMAVVNDTISKMRDEVKKNPKNESAKQVLYSSYQNKIDLLNSVAQKEELVASLK